MRSIARANAPTPGQHEAVGIGRDRRVGRADDLGADVLQRLLDRPQVAHPVVENRKNSAQRRALRFAFGLRDHVSVPLVDGTPSSSGSIAIASRRARANALKQASIRWWRLVP